MPVRPILLFSTLLASLLLMVAAPGQTAGGTLPAGTPLPLEMDEAAPLRMGQAIHAHTMYAAYAGNEVVLPARTVVEGTVVGLKPDQGKRVRARFGGDFTPFYTPLVQFNRLVLAGGSEVALAGATATDGAPVYRIVATPPAKGSFLHKELATGIKVAREDVATVVGPGNLDRLKQLILNQLPYHPQRIEKDTSWTIETAEALAIPAQPAPPEVVAPVTKPHWWMPQPEETVEAKDDPGTWMLQADLAGKLDSGSTTVGTPVVATVVEPVWNPDHTIAVPQGAKLLGAVTSVKRARRFGRAGVLRFDIRQIQLPDQPAQTVQATLRGADSTSGELALDSEGTAKPKPQDKLTVPLILGLLAAQTLDGGEHGGSEGQARHRATGSNGIGFIGTIAGLAGGTNVAAGIGFYGTALSVYDRFIARGKEVTFAKDTRVVVQTTARKTSAIKPERGTVNF